MSKPKLAGVARFAHLLGINPKSSVADDEDNDALERMDGESDEDYAKRCEDEKAKKAKKAEKDDVSDDKPDEEDEAGDNDDDDESRKDKASRKAERARCAAIFGCKASAARPDMAAHLAFETNMSASDAVKMLGAIAAGQPKPSGIASRMSSVNVPVVGADEGERASAPTNATEAASVAASAILAAGRKARGEPVKPS